jgi:hypothetical protein
MYGLTVRWSLGNVPEGTERALRDYVGETSWERFTGMSGLSFKTWRMRSGEWFEGTYVWATQQDRDAFAAAITENTTPSTVSLTIGAGPELIETFDVLAVAEGGEGFVPGIGPGADG